MNEVKILDSSYKEVWNSLAYHPAQSWQWGEIREKQGLEIIRIGEFENGDLTSVYQITLHKLPILNKFIGHLAMSKVPSRDVIDFIYKSDKFKSVACIKVEPYELNSNSSIPKLKNIKLTSDAVYYKSTIFVDLDGSEEDLLKKMKQKTRYNIRLAEKKGVYVKEVSDQEGFETFYKLYHETCLRQSYFGRTKSFHELVWNNLKGNISKILVAYYQDTPLAAFEVFYFNNVIYYCYGGTSVEYRNLMGANLLMWETMKLGKSLGAKKFDMWGIQSAQKESDKDLGGVTRFKEGYGGDIVDLVDSFDLILNNFYYKIYLTMNKSNSILNKFKKTFRKI